MIRISPFGDRAVRFELPAGTDRRALLSRLRALPSVDDVVITESHAAVVTSAASSVPAIAAALSQALAPDPGAPAASSDARAARDRPTESAPIGRHVVEVVYDGEDIDAVAAQLGMGRADVARLHTEAEYEVAMMGFLPGFAYMRGLDRRLVLARRAAPRPRVPAGSVAIAAGYTGIYPFASPGGWHLLGEASGFHPFDGGRATFALGDRVRFEAIPRGDARAAARVGATLEGDGDGDGHGAHLVVTRAAGMSVVVDGGRRGHMHEGVPPGGPLVRSALAAANAAAGNPPGAAAIEIYGALEITASGGAVDVATDDGRRVTLAAGESLSVSTGGRSRARYLAPSGGFDVPVVLGARCTLLVAHLGGFEGRALRRGDRLRVGGARADDGHASATDAGALRARDVIDTAAPVALHTGPDVDAGAALEPLFAPGSIFRIASSSDRTGTRLEGPPLPASLEPTSMQSARTDERRSTPMVLGAVELTPSGLIVLGPDHPVTGGYPVVGVVCSSSLDMLFARPLGSPVRFCRATRV